MSLKKEPAPGASNLAFVGGLTPDISAPSIANNSYVHTRGDEFAITLDKSEGTRLGIDVDHQDGTSLLIENINGGLVEAWNDAHPDQKVKQGDRIIEVNSIRDDVLQLVDECKKNQVLCLKLRREQLRPIANPLGVVLP